MLQLSQSDQFSHYLQFTLPTGQAKFIIISYYLLLIIFM
jgi:hypothetical protein